MNATAHELARMGRIALMGMVAQKRPDMALRLPQLTNEQLIDIIMTADEQRRR